MPVRWVDEIPSTQELAHVLAEQGAAHGTAVAARAQTAGRGTRGRTWHSPRGGLWMSVICRPEDPAAAECLSVRVGLAVAGALEARCPGIPSLALKWPNDLFLQGRKLGGILCEARWLGGRLAWIVAGVGINVTNPIADDLAATAIALGAVVPDVEVDPLAEAVAACVADRVRIGGPLSAEELASFSRRDCLIGRRLTEPVHGMADGITPTGALRVRLAEGGVATVVGGVVIAKG